MLVFLPGAAEIRRAQTACAALADRHGWLLLPLHGDQSPEEQDHAVGPSDRRKIILSTNVAESSVTIEGVSAVVDSGVARVASHSPWSGLPVLQVSRISQASANQRAGRAGRTGPGCAIRLYPLEDFVRRPAHDTPEIARADLAPVALLLDALGAAGFHSLAWLDAPPPAAIEHATALLAQLGATGALAREMARYPLHPRLARLVVEARRRGVAEDGCTVAALLSAGERLAARQEHATRSDLLVLMESPWEPRTAQTVRQVRRMVDPPRQRTHDEDALLISVLAAFPDRVARRRQGAELQLAAGGPAQLAPSSTVTAEEFLVAVEAEDRRDQKAPLVRIASGVQPGWLVDFFPERIRETSRVEWNRAAERVESVSALWFDQIAIEESRGAGRSRSRRRAAGLESDGGGDRAFRRYRNSGGISQSGALRGGTWSCAAARSRSGSPRAGYRAEELRRTGVGRTRRGGADDGAQMPPAARRLLEEVAPERIKLPRGRSVAVHYESGQAPWIASRLQDFFGMRSTPTVALGAVPVAVHLLAPNQRPVQMTTDIGGFWERLYPQVRRELSRRYPRHAWPEDPE